MNKRTLKIYGTWLYGNKEVPLIRLQGEWLKKLGFKKGEKTEVIASYGKITITALNDERIKNIK